MSTVNSLPIPDLWPKGIEFVPVLAPVAILQHQATLLGQKSNGLLEAELSTSQKAEEIVHELRLVAPSLDRYTRPLLRVSHGHELSYPCTVFSDLDSSDADAHTPKELIENLAAILSSGSTQAIIFSLLARMSEKSESAKSRRGA